MAVPVSLVRDTPVAHGSYPALSRPLTVLGCERRVFLGAASLGAAAFSSFNAPLAGLLLFACGYGAGLLATRSDPALPAVILRSAGSARRYDPALRSADPDPLEVAEGGTR